MPSSGKALREAAQCTQQGLATCWGPQLCVANWVSWHEPFTSLNLGFSSRKCSVWCAIERAGATPSPAPPLGTAQAQMRQRSGLRETPEGRGPHHRTRQAALTIPSWGEANTRLPVQHHKMIDPFLRHENELTACWNHAFHVYISDWSAVFSTYWVQMDCH